MERQARGSAALLALATVALAAAGCSTGSSPTSPARSINLALDYSAPAGLAPPPDPTCADHWAPVNLQVTTDWIFSVALQPAANGHYTLNLRNVPAGSHWLVLYDTRLCGQDPTDPVAMTGVSIGGVALTRQTTTTGGGKALGFTVDGFGGVHP